MSDETDTEMSILAVLRTYGIDQSFEFGRSLLLPRSIEICVTIMQECFKGSSLTSSNEFFVENRNKKVKSS